jgi:hypothetical protein
MAKYNFVRGGNETLVWDPKANKVLVEFVQGLYSTDSDKIAKTLHNLGYKEQKDYPYGPPEDGFTAKKTLLPPPKMELSPGGPAAPTKQPDVVTETAEVDQTEDVAETVIDQKPKRKLKKTTKKA